MLFIKSTFIPNKIETDSEIYGVKEDIIRDALMKLFNNGSILITGVRGIGKSSMQYQLQQTLNGETKDILDKCNLTIKIPKYFTFAYECLRGDDLGNIFYSILQQMVDCLDCGTSIKISETKIGIALGVLNIELTGEKVTANRYQTLINTFIDGVMGFFDMYENPYINIAIDEIDQLNENCGIAHGIKIILETLSRYNIDSLSFILAGQNGTLETLLSQQPSFNRIVKHFQLKALDEEIARTVFISCINKLEGNIQIENKGLDILVKAASGYPYLIHLLGEESLNIMLQQYEQADIHNTLIITQDDCVKGVFNVLKNNVMRYRYLWLSLSSNEQNLLQVLTTNDGGTFYDNIKTQAMLWEEDDIVNAYIETYPDAGQDTVHETLKKLYDNQILEYEPSEYENNLINCYFFCEEMFRIYLTLGESYFK